MTRRYLIIALVFLCSAAVTPGITLEAYKAKVEAGWVATYEMEKALTEDEADDLTIADFAASMKERFPASEPVEWSGGTVEATNDWLLDRVRNLETEKDRQKQKAIVIELRELVGAIVSKLQEMAAAEQSGLTKDEEKRKLAEILRREEFQKPVEKQESAFQRWLSDFIAWLESWFPKPAATPNVGGMDILASVLQIVLFATLGALLVYLIFRLATRLFPQLQRVKKQKKKPRVILGEQIGEDATASDLFSEAERLAREGDLRGAIRKGYIALLCELSDRKIIGLARHKTNRDYLRDVRSIVPLHPRMREATETFERNWYGGERSDEQAWTKFRQQYNEAIRSV